MHQRLALFARQDRNRAGFLAAAERAGLDVLLLPAEPAEAAALIGHATLIYRAPGGLLAAAARIAGVTIRLSGPTPDWFVGLGAEITGRAWQLTDAVGARAALTAAPGFCKLADAKHRQFPARWFTDPAALTAALDAAGLPEHTALLLTGAWLDIDSEYRVFTCGRQVLTSSPYLVQDDPWSPLLHTHRASFLDEATEHAQSLLGQLADVPPAAALDIARLVDGRFVLLEANQCWGAGLYGCDPHAALAAVRVANDPAAPGEHDQWLWRPDPAVHTDTGSAARQK